MLEQAIVNTVREEVRAAFRKVPTVQSVLEDMGFLVGTLPPADAVMFARIAIKPLADLIDSAPEPEPEPEPETTGANGTGEEKEE